MKALGAVDFTAEKIYLKCTHEKAESSYISKQNFI